MGAMVEVTLYSKAEVTEGTSARSRSNVLKGTVNHTRIPLEIVATDRYAKAVPIGKDIVLPLIEPLTC